jgi:hypothetical protein
MDSNGLWFKRSNGNLPLPPSGCGTMEASAMIPTTKSNRPGIHANANRRPTYERSSRQASMRWGARWARERGYSAPRPRFLPSRGSGALNARRGPNKKRAPPLGTRPPSGMPSQTRRCSFPRLCHCVIGGVAAAVADRVAANHSFERRQGPVPRPTVRTSERHREESSKLRLSRCALGSRSMRPQPPRPLTRARAIGALSGSNVPLSPADDRGHGNLAL